MNVLGVPGERDIRGIPLATNRKNAFAVMRPIGSLRPRNSAVLRCACCGRRVEGA